METHKKGFFERFLSAAPGLKKERDLPWKVILKGIPDKQAEGNFVSILTGKLNTSADDALKITKSLPIVLFSNLTSHEAEEIKLFLNETGVRSAISNDPDEMRNLGKVTWPKKVTIADLTDFDEHIPAPPPFASSSTTEPESPKLSEPSFPSKPVIPLKPKPVIPLPLPQPLATSSSTHVENRGIENEKLIVELEILRAELKTQLERLEKLLHSLKEPVPPVPGLKGNPLLPPRVR